MINHFITDKVVNKEDSFSKIILYSGIICGLSNYFTPKDQIEFEKKFQLELGFSPILIGKFKKSGGKLINVID